MEAVYLTRIVDKVTVIHRRDRLRAEKLLQDRIFAAGNADFLWDTVVEEVLGDKEVTGLKLKNVKTNETSELEVAAVFVFIGLVPNTEFLQGLVELDEYGFVKADARMRTSNPNIFAAGDVRADSVRQIGVAVGEAITAAVTIQEDLDTQTPKRLHLKASV
jgi:thioredoxin reductase (NADPH)